jgi:hypothetical protein
LIFQLDTNTTIEKLKIHTNREGNKLIDIERISSRAFPFRGQNFKRIYLITYKFI